MDFQPFGITSAGRDLPASDPDALATLGTYPDSMVVVGGNTTVTPDAAPTGARSINIATNSNFKGTLVGDPMTGVVRVTNANPAGTYTVTVKAFEAGSVTSTTFTLTVVSGTVCNPVQFTNGADVSVGATPNSVAVGDFNNDGNQDVASANSNASTVSIRLGDGLGGFSGSIDVGVGLSPVSVAIGDFNNDGNQDFAAANLDSSTVSIRLGDGLGGFSGATNVSVGVGPAGVAIGDFNNDGKQDFAAANIFANTVSIRLADDLGGFGGTTEVSVGTHPFSVVIGDFNNDGNQDFASANNLANTVSIRLGDGSGDFNGTTDVSVGNSPTSVAIGDFNNDGKQDFASANNGANTISIRLGDSLGGFNGTTNVSVGASPTSIAIGDFNNDGKQDFATGNNGANTVSIRLGDGLGSFSGITNVSVGNSPTSVAIGDFNNDGKQDFASANQNANTVSIRLGGCVATPTPTPTPNSVQFSAANYPVGEAAGSVVLTVTRTGATNVASNVDYATDAGLPPASCDQNNGVASERCDYTMTLGTLQFAANETSKTVSIFITDDTYSEAAEAFTVTLSNSTSGLTIGTPGTTSVTITDNDVANGQSPVKNGVSFNNSFFVRQQYIDFLNREPDAGGLAFWKNQLDECENVPLPDGFTDAQNCREVRRINVSAAFFVSIEFQSTGYLVYRFNQAAFNLGPTLQFRSFLKDTQEIQRGVIVGQGNWQLQIDSNKLAFANAFVARPEFVAVFLGNMTADAFVDALNANTKDPSNPTTGSLTQAERANLVATLSANPSSAILRAQVLRSLAENSVFQQREFTRAFVLMQYFGYLRRNPNALPDTDFGGYNFWLGKLNQFNGNFVDAELVKAFITSGEYINRFGPN